MSETPPNSNIPTSSEAVVVSGVNAPVTIELKEPEILMQRASADPPPISHRKKQSPLWFAVVIALLLCLWGIINVHDPDQFLAAGPSGAPSLTTAPSNPYAHPVTDLFGERDNASYHGLGAGVLLHTHVRFVGTERDDDSGTDVVLSDVITRQRVTVVNLWATWCGPCMTELVGFRAMFEMNGWRDETRFVPILVDDLENMRSAYPKWGGHMPLGAVALVDLKLDRGGVRGALAQIKSLELEESLPITLLFDCRQRVRWSRMSALDDEAFAQLADEINMLRAELNKPFCRPSPIRPPLPDTSTR